MEYNEQTIAELELENTQLKEEIIMMQEELATVNERLKEEIVRLDDELTATKAHLKRYTSPAGKKEYYEKNKERIKEARLKAGYAYKYAYDPEKRKEYNQRAYLKKKERLQKEAEEKLSKEVDN